MQQKSEFFFKGELEVYSHWIACLFSGGQAKFCR